MKSQKHEVVSKVSIHNRFDIEVINAKTGEVRQRAQAENIVLDYFWETLFTQIYSMFKEIHYGQGTGTLSAARTTLFSSLGYKTATASGTTLDKANKFVKNTKYISILENEHVGSYLKEVGLGATYSTVRRLVTHALIKDMNGNPVEILKTDTDIINIYGTLYLYFDATTIAEWDSGHIRMAHPSDNYLTSNQYVQWLIGNRDCPREATYWGNSLSYGCSPRQRGSNNDLVFLPTRTTDTAGKWLKLYYRCPAASMNSNPRGTCLGIGNVSIQPTFGGSNYGNDIEFNILGSTAFPEGVVIGETLQAADGIRTRFQTVFNRLKSITEVRIDGTPTAAYTANLLMPYSTDLGDMMRIIDSQQMRFAGTYYTMNPGCPNGTWTTFENTAYQSMGIDKVTIKNLELYASDDMESWTQVAYRSSDSNLTVTIPSEHKGKRYWQARTLNSGSYNYPTILWIGVTPTDYMNIEFTNPPGLVTGEAVGTGDGVEDEFTLDNEPIAGSLTMKLDGVEETHWTIVGAVVTFDPGYIPGSGVAVTADYRYAALVTIDYKTTCVPKDVNHVFDVTFILQFGEYTP